MLRTADRRSFRLPGSPLHVCCACPQIFKCANGRSVRQIGSNGRGDGKFDEPVDVAVRKNHLLVADSQNARIQEFDLEGNFIASVRAPSRACFVCRARAERCASCGYPSTPPESSKTRWQWP